MSAPLDNSRLWREALDIVAGDIRRHGDLPLPQAPAMHDDIAFVRSLARDAAAQHDGDGDRRNLLFLEGLRLPVGPIQGLRDIWDFKRAADYLVELRDDMRRPEFVTAHRPRLRDLQRQRHLPLAALIQWRLPPGQVARLPISRLYEATVPVVCHLLDIRECDIFDPLPTKVACDADYAGLDVRFWLSEEVA